MTVRPDPRIDAYIAEAEPFARPILQHLRALVHGACPDVEETIKWNMPFFVSHGSILAMMSAFKAHAGFGFWHPEMKRIAAPKAGVSADGMGHLGRLTAITDLPSDATLRRWLKQAVALNAGAKAGAPRPRKRRPELPVPPDLQRRLQANAAARARFKAFPPSHRREYIQWIIEAKRPETRERRLTDAVAWIAAGKPQNWRYLAT